MQYHFPDLLCRDSAHHQIADFFSKVTSPGVKNALNRYLRLPQHWQAFQFHSHCTIEPQDVAWGWDHLSCTRGSSMAWVPPPVTRAWLVELAWTCTHRGFQVEVPSSPGCGLTEPLHLRHDSGTLQRHKELPLSTVGIILGSFLLQGN